MVQVINQPTRITPASATLLDVIANKADVIISHNVVPQVVSDHDLIIITVNVSKPKRRPNSRTFRHLGNYFKDDFCSPIFESSHEMNRILTTDNVNKQVEIFTNLIVKFLDQCAPAVTEKAKRPFTTWLNDEILKTMRA